MSSKRITFFKINSRLLTMNNSLRIHRFIISLVSIICFLVFDSTITWGQCNFSYITTQSEMNAFNCTSVDELRILGYNTSDPEGSS